jgi:hypothetical protein
MLTLGSKTANCRFQLTKPVCLDGRFKTFTIAFSYFLKEYIIFVPVYNILTRRRTNQCGKEEFLRFKSGMARFTAAVTVEVGLWTADSTEFSVRTLNQSRANKVF